MTDKKTVEQWGTFEIALRGTTEGNPFTDSVIEGIFVNEREEKKVPGFYDGENIYRVRFMPSFQGEYDFCITGNCVEKITGSFTAVKPSAENHGPVHVSDQVHFSYADGTYYYPVGTTCYAWAHQTQELQTQTLESLKNSCFNKLRFCVFPKHYRYNYQEPPLYPYEGEPNDFGEINWYNYKAMNSPKDTKWDFSRFNPEYFRHFEKCIEKLMKLGIEADIILMHNYDRWGFSVMPAWADELYYRYVTARFSAYRNVWWSQANEFDLVPDKTVEDWERLGKLLMKEDPYGHLRSIHNCRVYYDNSQCWVTHCSLQRIDIYKTVEETEVQRQTWGKPVVVDEMCYEGDICMDWGNIPAWELVRRCWEITLRGGYTGHSEVFENETGTFWWSQGGLLRGISEPRLRFLRQILEETPAHGLRFLPWKDSAVEGGGVCGVADNAEINPSYRIYYFGWYCPRRKSFQFPEDETWQAQIIDTWNMTIMQAGKYTGKFWLELPARQYMAVRLVRVGHEKEKVF
ncbi:MAG: DUF5605 domain-containing protein [Acetatifactor sp.]|nr:DUF5605 domain-containing protein [Acetatifactor sp.]